jgi:quercetin dioxygenase-like cupin family protein
MRIGQSVFSILSERLATMNRPRGVFVAAGEGPVTGLDTAPGRSFALRLLSSATDERVMMFEETAPPGTDTPLHVHHESDEVAYVLTGEVAFKMGDELAVGGPGACVFMPRDIPHAWKTSGPEPARILFLYTPARAGEFFEELARSSVGSGDEHALAGLVERHDMEVVGPSPF